MTSRDFCYWLQGYFEVSGARGLTEEQANIVKTHLAMAFKHEIDPSFGKDNPPLDTIHNASGPWPPDKPMMRC